MRMSFLRPLLALVALFFATFGLAAGTLTVTSPTEGDYLGRSNTVVFNITGATLQVTVEAVATAPNGTKTTVNTKVNPDNDGKASGTISLPFTPTAQQGTYSLVVTATEQGNTYNQTVRSVIVDVDAPKFIELSPVSNSYAKTTIRIRASVEEANVDTWKVEFNGDQIFSEEGTNDISLDYDITGVELDGSQNVRIVVTDLAGNSTERTIPVIIDTTIPIVEITFPTASGKAITSGQDVDVLINITDASSTSVDRTGVEVTLRRTGTNGAVFARVTFVRLTGTSGTAQLWTGRVRYAKNLFPKQFVVSARVVDRAGNRAMLQEVTAKYGKQ